MSNKSISVSPETHDKLKAMGGWNESMDSIIKRLIIVYKTTQEGKEGRERERGEYERR